jgi:hypothetical protein
MKKPNIARLVIIHLTLILFLAFLSEEADADSKQFQWSTRISISEEYDDNIFLAPDNEEDDWITSVTPGLTLTVFTEETEVSLDYDLSFQWYATNSEYDDARHTLSLSGLRGIPIAEHLTLDLDESFQISEDPIETNEEVTSVRRSRERYYRNTFRGRINYLFGTEDTLYGGVRHILLENDDTALEDSEGYGADCGINYWFNIHHGFGLDYSYTRGEFDVSDDYDQHIGRATYTYRYSPQTRVNLFYSYDSFDYDGAREDYEVHSSGVRFSHDFTEHTSGSISGGYYVQDPERSDKQEGLIGTVSFERTSARSTLSLRGSTGYRQQLYEAENLGLSEYYLASGAFSYRLLERLSASISGLYREDDYQETASDRKDKTWGGGTALNWLMLRWLSVSIDYHYRERESDDPFDEYTDNRVMLTLTAFHMGQPKPF